MNAKIDAVSSQNPDNTACTEGVGDQFETASAINQHQDGNPDKGIETCPGQGAPANRAAGPCGPADPGTRDSEVLTAVEAEDSPLPTELLSARASIDNIDAALVHLLAERFRCTQRVGHLKARFHLPAEDKQREAAQILRLRELANNSGLDPVFAEKFLRFIVDEVIRHHRCIAEETES